MVRKKDGMEMVYVPDGTFVMAVIMTLMMSMIMKSLSDKSI